MVYATYRDYFWVGILVRFTFQVIIGQFLLVNTFFNQFPRRHWFIPFRIGLSLREDYKNYFWIEVLVRFPFQVIIDQCFLINTFSSYFCSVVEQISES